MAKVSIAFFFVLLLLYVGLRGRQQARLQGRLDDVTVARDQLQQRLEDEQRLTEPIAAGVPGTNTTASRPPLSTPQVTAFVSALKTRLEQFDSAYSQGELSGIESLQIRLSRATLANAEERFGDALTMLTDADEHGKRSDSEAQFGLSARVFQIRGDSFYGLREWREALERYRQVLLLQPNRIAALARVAECQYALGGLKEAFTTYDELAKSHTTRGDSFLIQGKPDAAIGHYQKAIEIQTRLIQEDGRRELATELALSHNHRGNASLIQGKWDPAIAQYSKAIEIQTRLIEQEGRSDLAMELALSHKHRGDAFLGQGKLDAARGEYEKAVEIQTRLIQQEGRSELANDLARSHHNLGNSLLVQGKLDATIGHYERAIEIQTRLVEQERRSELANELAGSLNNRGVARRAQGKLDAAIADFENAIRILTMAGEQQRQSERVMLHANRGMARRAQATVDVVLGYSDKAIDALIRTRLIEQAGRRQEAVVLAMSLKNRGYSHLVQGKQDAAFGDFKKAMEIYARLVQQEGQVDLKPEFARTLTPVAWIYATNPDKSIRDGNKAKEFALKACELSEWKAFVPLETLAAAYAETGNFADAAKWQEKAMELAPGKSMAELRSRLELYKSGNPYRAPRSRAE